MTERVLDERQQGLFVWRDNPPSGPTTSIISTEYASGRLKYFNGSVGGRHVQSFPPPLHPVTIGDLTFRSKVLNFDIQNVPVWGSRFFSGTLGAVLAGDQKIRELVLAPPFGANHVPDDLMVGTALQKAYANINTSDFNGQLFMAELSETLSMLKNPLSGIKKIHEKYSRSRKRIRDLLKAETKATADVYLQYMFGVKPLISDIQSIYATVMDEAKEVNQLYGKGSIKRISERSDLFETGFGYGLHSCKSFTKTRQEIRTTSKVYYKVTWESEMWQLMQKWGFNPIMLPVTAWETYPLSFVLDWFLGVKLWLQAIAPKPGICTLGNYVSEKLVQVVDIHTLVASIAPMSEEFRKTWVFEDVWGSTYERLIRQVNLPMPNYPLIAQGLNDVGKATSMAFLAIQKIRF